jgi:hypothetical protein
MEPISTHPQTSALGSSTALQAPATSGQTAVAPKVSTTTISNANKIDQVPTLNNQLAQISTKGVTTNPETGVAQYADGSVYNEPTKESLTSQLGEAQKALDAYTASQAKQTTTPTATTPTATSATAQPTQPVPVDTSKYDRETEQLMNDMKKNLDSTTKGLIDNIQQKFEQRRIEQRDINERTLKANTNALLMGGVTGQGSSAQYAPISSQGILASTESYGLKQIAALDAMEQDAIMQAKAAQQAGNFQLLEKKLALAEKKRAEKIEAATKLNEQIAEQNQKMLEQEQQSARDFTIVDLFSQGVTDPTEMLRTLKNSGANYTLKEVNETLKNIIPAGVNDLVKTLKTNGAPVGVIQKVLSSRNMSEAYENAGTYASGGTGMVGEYNFYRAQAEANGQVPVDFQTYQDIDANRKKSIAKAGTASSVSEGTIIDKSDDPFIQGLLDTKGGKALTDTTIQKLDKGLTTLGQLGVLQANIQEEKTGPIVGAFKSANPWDTKGQVIKSQLNAIVPNLARGVYGEVGVLTDADVELYSKTIPNLKSQKEVRDALLYITLDMIGKSIKNTLSVNKAAGRDVSGFVDIYTEMEDTKNSILNSIPGAKVPDSIKMNSNIIKTEAQAEDFVINYGKTNVEVRDKIQEMVADRVPYLDIKSALGI